MDIDIARPGLRVRHVSDARVGTVREVTRTGHVLVVWDDDKGRVVTVHPVFLVAAVNGELW
jgi:hypothetical protein